MSEIECKRVVCDQLGRGGAAGVLSHPPARLYWMLKQNVGYPEIARIESSSRVALRGKSHLATLNEHSRIQQWAGCPHGSIMARCRWPYRWLVRR